MFQIRIGNVPNGNVPQWGLVMFQIGIGNVPKNAVMFRNVP
jgi:hypothetical protein